MKRPLTYVALGWGLLTASGLLINGGLHGDVAGNAWRLLESGMLLAVLLGLAAYSPLRTAFQGLGAARASALLGLVGAGQVVDRPRMTYPFVPWSMYSQADVSPEYVEYHAALQSGRAIDFPFHRIIPTHEPRSVSYNFSGRLRRTDGTGGNVAAAQEVARLIVSLAKIYNQRHPSDPIRHIDIRLRSILLDHDRPESVAIRHVIRVTVPAS